MVFIMITDSWVLLELCTSGRGHIHLTLEPYSAEQLEKHMSIWMTPCVKRILKKLRKVHLPAIGQH